MSDTNAQQNSIRGVLVRDRHRFEAFKAQMSGARVMDNVGGVKTLRSIYAELLATREALESAQKRIPKRLLRKEPKNDGTTK